MKKNLKKKIVSTLIVVSLLSSVFIGCGKAKENTIIKVGATPTPHAEILEIVKDDLAEKGYTLEIVSYNDYVLPNNALENEELDANYFQHEPYLDNFNKENGTHLVSVSSIHYEPFALYPGKTSNLLDLKNGAKIAIPNDATNEARALLLLEQAGLIKLREGAGLEVTVLDIVDNPNNYEIIEIESAQLPRSLQDVDLAAINANYAVEAKLDVNKALVTEDTTSIAAQTYANIIVVKEGHENDEKIKALIAALNTDEVREYINNTYNGAVVPIF